MEISYACLVGQMNNYFAQFPYAIPDVTETEIAQLRILVNVGSDGLDRNVTNVFVYLGVLMEVAYIHLSVLAMKVMRACFVINVSTLFRKKSFMLDEMLQQNASKFAIFLEYKNLGSFSCYFISFPNECPG